MGRVPTDARRLDVFHLGSEVRDADRSKTIHFDVDFDAACVDPGQDLVVLTRAAFAPNNGFAFLIPLLLLCLITFIEDIVLPQRYTSGP